MDAPRKASDGWLDPALGGRVSSHTLAWTRDGQAETLASGGDIFYHQVPAAGTAGHCHDFSEIVLVSSGTVTHVVNGERQELVPGSLVFLRPDDIHAFAPAAGAGAGGASSGIAPAEVLLLDFDLELFLSLSVFFENDQFLQQLTAPVLPPSFVIEAAEAGNLINRLLRLNSPGVPPAVGRVRFKLELASLFAHYFIDEANRLQEAHVPDWLENLCREMRREENFTAGVERMQALACRTPGHLCKSFQRYLGKTPTDFVNGLRVNHAARLLQESDEDIAMISARLNFQSLSHFYRLFKHEYGVTPAAYRKLRSPQGA